MFIVLFLVVYLLQFVFIRVKTARLQEPSAPFCSVLNELILRSMNTETQSRIHQQRRNIVPLQQNDDCACYTIPLAQIICYSCKARPTGPCTVFTSVYNVLCRCTILQHCGRVELVLELFNFNADGCVVQVWWTSVAVWDCWIFMLIIVLCRFGGLLPQCGIVGLLC